MTKNEDSGVDQLAARIHTQALLHQHDFTIKKKFGQNFLTDTNILTKISAAADLNKNTNVIEIGPGLGALTQHLLAASAEVMAFEIDHGLIPILHETLTSHDNLQLIEADVLKVDLADYIGRFADPTRPLKVVANLPYYITTAILLRLLALELPISQIVVMMQREVADRIAAQPGTKAYGSLSIAVQYQMTASIAFAVPRTVFVPVPNVDSSVLVMTRREAPLVAVADEAWFFKVVRLAFVHRRKTLMNNLLAAFGKERKSEIEPLLGLCAIAPDRRAETLSIAEFGHLSDALLPLKIIEETNNGKL